MRKRLPVLLEVSLILLVGLLVAARAQEVAPRAQEPTAPQGLHSRARIARTCSDPALAPSGAPMGLRGGALPTDRKARRELRHRGEAVPPSLVSCHSVEGGHQRHVGGHPAQEFHHKWAQRCRKEGKVQS